LSDHTAPLKELKSAIHKMAGDEAAEEIMLDYESLRGVTDSAKVAHWVKGAMEHMDQLLPVETRSKIMV